MQTQRSAGIAVFSLMLIFFGFLGALSSFQALMARNDADITEEFHQSLKVRIPELEGLILENPALDEVITAYRAVAASGELRIVNIVNIAASCVIMFLGVGMWKLIDRARIATIYYFIASIPLYIWMSVLMYLTVTREFVIDGVPILPHSVGSILVIDIFIALVFCLFVLNAAIVAYYLTRPNVRSQFTS